MKVEFGFQANCSEMLVYLGLKSRAEVIQGMKRIQEITGWIWRYASWYQNGEEGEENSGKKCYILIPIDELDSMIVLDLDTKVFKVDPKKLVRFWQEVIPDSVKNTMSLVEGSEWEELEPILMDIPPDVPILRIEKVLGLDFGYFHEWNVSELHINTFYPGVEQVPRLHRVRQEYKGSCTGKISSPTYRDWLAYHFIDKEKLKKIWTKYGFRTDKEALQKTLERYENNPPLSGSGPLNEDEVPIIREHLASRKSYYQKINKEWKSRNKEYRKKRSKSGRTPSPPASGV